MKWNLKVYILIIGALACRAEVDGGNVSGQDVTAEDVTAKPSTVDDSLSTAKNLLPDLSKLHIPETIAKALPGEPIVPRHSSNEKPDLDDLHLHDSNLEDGQKVFEEKCRQLGGEEAVKAAQLAKDRVMECAQSLLNVTELQEEIDANKANGELDTVFKKHCRKAPRFRECLSNFTTAIDPCLKEEERVTKSFLFNVTDAMLGFICFKEGDRIALFIAEGGPDCMLEKQQEVKNCLNKTLYNKLPKEMPGAESLPTFVIEEEGCMKITEIQDCVVKHLETCKEPTPANIVESMINYLKKSSPCAKYMAVNSSPSVISALTETIFSSLVVFIALAFK